ncbi:TIGR03560 family F420-dependent LLM class oxidoreductase [Litorilinea aerophila]|nr:TIGR03560 family F420-dependent LLM class oxidoreductase [Litorilinea aerophila]MCC9076327.1 TIGR03560 family F420-dependent LLM class oxidoreductase [Litorilinea aerophila]GIV78061.1 MAG: LLM class F420-dependent oxidoreductase [Litorilinea sp.]
MSTVQFGWRVPAFPVDGSSGPDFVQQIVRNLEALGDAFDSAWVADHFIPWARFAADDIPTLECLSTICYLAGAFPRLKFGTIVLCQSYRNPALLAKMGATLQLLSSGRFILGIGAGWKEDEYRAYGYDFPKPATRIRQLEEAVQIVRRLWTETPATFHGRHYHIEHAYCEPKPNPRPPILIGGGGEQLTLRVVARHADWWNIPGGTLENYRHKLEVLRRHCDAEGRDYDEIRKTWAVEVVAVAETEAEARRMAEASPFYSGAGLVGTPDQVAEQLRAFTELGCSYFIARFADFPRTEGVRLFAERVIPQFQ